MRDYFSFISLQSHGVFNIISQRSWGSTNPFVGYEALQRISAGLGCESEEILNRIVFAEQVHSNRVYVCSFSDGGSIRLSMDALISGEKHHILAIYSSDCIPLLVYDPKCKVIGAIHAGYKGLAKGVLVNTITEFQRQFGSNPSELIVGMAPFIRKCCYEIKEDLFDSVENVDWRLHTQYNFGRIFLDLEMIAKTQLYELGVLPEKIEDLGICTACRSDILFSSRRKNFRDDKGSSFISLIGLSDLKTP